MQDSKLIEVSVKDFQFDFVAINDSPCYRRFSIRNLLQSTVDVSLESSSSSVKFQRGNENVNDETECVCSAVSAFDKIHLVNDVSLSPGETVSLIAVFTADAENFSHVTPHGTNCNGVVTVFARECAFPTSPNRQNIENMRMGKSPGVTQEERIQFFSRVYLSSMIVQPTELQCSLYGGEKSRMLEFTIQNVSSRPLLFVLRMASVPSLAVQIDITEEQDPTNLSCLGRRNELVPHETRKFFVTVTPTSMQPKVPYTAVVQCDNLRDMRNTTLLQIGANLCEGERSESERSGDLIAIRDPFVDFKELYFGSAAKRTIVISNVCASDVSLKLLRSKGDFDSENCSISLFIDDDCVDDVTIAGQRTQMILGLQLQTRHPKASDGKTVSKISVRMDIEFLATCRTPHRQQQQRVTLRCQAVLHTSGIIVAQPNIHFGDCEVGRAKKTTVQIENLSPLSGSARIQLRSKIISVNGRRLSESEQAAIDVELAPNAAQSVELEIVPQRVNPTYKKQMIISNFNNPSQRFTVNIEANNMAPNETKTHDERYEWECVLPPDEPLRAVVGSPLLVPFAVRSKSSNVLTLHITTSSPEIDMLELLEDADTIEGNELRVRFETARSVLNNVYRQVEELGSEEVTSARDELTSMITNRTRAVDTIYLRTGEIRVVYVRIHRSCGSQGTDFQLKEDGVYVRVDGIDQQRFVRLSYRLFSTQFEVAGQRTKHFGDVNIGERKVTKLSLVNKCKSVLYFSIMKSRSVTARHVRVGKVDSDRQVYYGFVRAFATRDVDIAFLPGIKGSFEEKLRVTNVLDPRNEVVVIVKAQVTKVDTFDVAPESWSFGDVTLGEDGTCRVGAKLMVSNTSRTRRELRVRLESTSNALAHQMFRLDGIEARVQLDMEHIGASSGSTRKIEEQIEKLEQKLKIYERKQKVEKIVAARKRIEALQRALQGEEVDLNATDDHDLSSSEDEGGAPSTSSGGRSVRSRVPQSEMGTIFSREGVSMPSVGPSESIGLTLVLQCQKTSGQHLIPSMQSASLNVIIFEAKDQEVNRIVPVDITLHVSASASNNGIAGLHSPISTETHGDTSAETTLLVSEPPQEKSLANHSTQLSSVSQLALTSMLSSSLFLGSLLVPLHNTVLNDWTSTVVQLSSLQADTTFVILEPLRCGGPSSWATDAKFKFEPRNGFLDAKRSKEIRVDCYPRSVGPQRYLVPIKNIKSPSEIKYFCVELSPSPAFDKPNVEVDPRVLDFHRIVTPVGNDGEAQQAPPVRVITIKNQQQRQIVLVRSNRPSQVLLFRDQECTHPYANPTRLSEREVLRLFVKFQPSVHCNAAKAREVHAGIVVECVDPGAAPGPNQGYCVISSTTVGVRAVVGTGLIQVIGSHVVDLGDLPRDAKKVPTVVNVANVSDSFPIEFKCETSHQLSLDHPDGVYTLEPSGKVRIAVTIDTPIAGLISESLVIRNMSCNQPPTTVSICALKQDGAVTMNCQHLVFPIVAVERQTEVVDRAGSLHYRLFAPTTTSSKITNHSARDLRLAAKSASPIVMGSVDNSDASPTSLGVRVDAKHTQQIEWRLVDAPVFSDAEKTALHNLEVVTLHSSAHISISQVLDAHTFSRARNLPLVEQCVLIPKFTMRFAVSEGAVDPLEVDIGAIGKNRTKPEIEFRLKNLSSALPLKVRVECLPIVKTVKSVTVEPSAVAIVRALIDVDAIRQQGPLRYEVCFVNEQNCENEMTAVITGRFHTKLLRMMAAEAIAASTPTSKASPGSAVSVPQPLPVDRIGALVTPGGGASGRTGGFVSSDDRNTNQQITLPTLVVDMDKGRRNDAQQGGAETPGGAFQSEMKVSITCTEANIAAQVEIIKSDVFGETIQLHVKRYDAPGNAEILNFAAKSTSHTVRVRCSTDGSNLSKLVTSFFGTGAGSIASRSKDTAVARSPATGVPPAAAASHSVSFEDAVEIDNWRNAISPPKWLGKIVFKNSLTEEEVDVNCTLRAVSTFGVAEAMSVNRTATLRRMSHSLSDHSRPANRNWFVGSVTLQNHCSSHSVSLLALPCVSSKCASFVSMECSPSRSVILPGTKISLSIVVGVESGTELHIKESVALALVDDGVPFSGAVVRFEARDDVTGDRDDDEGNRTKPTDVVHAIDPPSLAALTITDETVLPASAPPPIKLEDCTPVGVLKDGRCYSYQLHFQVNRGASEVPPFKIESVASSTVEYRCTLVSQAPHAWLQLPAGSGTLKALESHTLRFAITCSEVGTFYAHVMLFSSKHGSSSANSQGDVIVLKLKCEIVVTASEGANLYDIISVHGKSIPQQPIRSIFTGTMFSDGSLLHPVFDIVNRSAEPLEFQLHVVRPFRVVYTRVHRFSADDSSDPVIESPAAGEGFFPIALVQDSDQAGSQQQSQSQDSTTAPVSHVPITSAQNIRIQLVLLHDLLHQNYVVVDPKSRLRVVLAAQNRGIPELTFWQSVRTVPAEGERSSVGNSVETLMATVDVGLYVKCRAVSNAVSNTVSNAVQESGHSISAAFHMIPTVMQLSQTRFECLLSDQPCVVELRNISDRTQTFVICIESTLITLVAPIGQSSGQLTSHLQKVTVHPGRSTSLEFRFRVPPTSTLPDLGIEEHVSLYRQSDSRDRQCVFFVLSRESSRNVRASSALSSQRLLPFVTSGAEHDRLLQNFSRRLTIALNANGTSLCRFFDNWNAVLSQPSDEDTSSTIRELLEGTEESKSAPDDVNRNTSDSALSLSILEELAVEAQWLGDEIHFFTALLRNSRTYMALSNFLMHTIQQHSVMKSFRPVREWLLWYNGNSISGTFCSSPATAPSNTVALTVTRLPHVGRHGRRRMHLLVLLSRLWEVSEALLSPGAQ